MVVGVPAPVVLTETEALGEREGRKAVKVATTDTLPVAVAEVVLDPVAPPVGVLRNCSRDW
jgi:hypothetical protein